MINILTLGLRGLLFWVVLRVAAALLSRVLDSFEQLCSWMMDPFIDWIEVQAKRFMPGSSTDLQGLAKRLGYNYSGITVWGWGKGRWGVGVMRLSRKERTPCQ